MGSANLKERILNAYLSAYREFFNLQFEICNLHGGVSMGRTVLPFSKVLEQEVQEWKKFRRGLRKEDQQFLDRLFEEARLHVQAGVYASRPWPFETILVSILLEHEKALMDLRSKLRALEEKERGQLANHEI
jgi:hypothetical protein